MNNEKAIIIGLWVIVGIGLAFAGFMLYSSQNVDAAPISRAAPGSTITTGTTGDGDVEISLTPRGIADGYIVFDLALNTHSVDLSAYDLTRIATLEYNGKSVHAGAAPQLGGHHINGAIAFPVQGTPQSFVVRINGIPQQAERVFAW